jgi:hypothetical protein
MKHFKQLVQELVESEYSPGSYEHGGVAGAGGRSAHSDLGSYRIELDEIVGRINAFIKEYTDRDFIDPTSLRNQLKARLNHVGLDFGGSFGTTPTHNLMKDGFLKSDMIKEFTGSSMILSLNVSRNDNSMFSVDAKIVPGDAS